MCIFHIHIFHAVSKIPCLCTKKCIDKINKIMQKFETSHFENTNFKKYIFLIYFFKNPILKKMKIQFFKKKTPLKKIGQSLIQKISFTHGLNFFLKNPFWNNPILNTGKSNEEKKTSFKQMVRAWSKKYPLLMASFFFEKSILKQSNFEYRKIQ